VSGRGKESESREKTAVYSLDSYLACMLLLSMAEQRLYIDNTKVFPTLPSSRDSFWRCS